MKKWITTLLGILLLILLLATAGIAYLYTQSGNNLVRKYLENEIRNQTQLPITFHTFRLSRGHLYFIAVLNNEASFGFDGTFDVLRRRLNGRYLFKATQAHYQHYTLRQANINGTVYGTTQDLKLKGKGTLLDGPLSYSLRIQNEMPKDIRMQVRKLPLNELLELAGQAPIAQGELNADIVIPSIGETGSRGRIIAQLDNAKFDAEKIAILYGYHLPKDRTSLRGEVHADLVGEQVRFEGNLLSDLLTLQLKNGQANLSDNNVACDIAMDARELAPLTQNQLQGPLKLSGLIKYDAIGIQGRAATQSLGGKITINYTKNISVRIRNVALEKLLHLLGEPPYAEGLINGRLTLDSPQTPDGKYKLALTKGHLNANTVNKEFGTTLPANTTFTLSSGGNILQGILTAQTKLSSRILKADLTQTRFDMQNNAFKTRYRLYIPNPLLLTGQKGKGIPVTLTGTVTQEKNLHIIGQTKGLGKKLTFDYADDRLKVLADDVAVERLLASSGQPIALSGQLDASIDLTSLQPLRGKVSLNAPRLTTHPTAMKMLIGEPLDTSFSLSLSGQAKNGIFFAKSNLKSPLAALSMPQIVFDTKDNALSSPYQLDIPDLTRLESLIGTRLQGPLKTKGKIKTGLKTEVSGTSASLGGTLTYHYIGTRLNLRVSKIPVIKLLHFVDLPEQFEGITDGTLDYDTQNRKGQAHLNISRFQFKPGKLTSGVKTILHKDLAQIIYDRTTLDAQFNGDNVGYKLNAKGRRSDFAIRDGKINTKTETHKASFGLRVDNVDVIGTIKGSISDPKITVLPGKMLRDKLKKKAGSLIKKNVNGSTKKLMKNLPKLF